MNNWAHEISKARSLDMLFKILVEAGQDGVRFDPASENPELRVDLSMLPHFGGFPPQGGIVPALSWDMRCVLAGESLATLRIVSRKAWGERRSA